MAVAIGTALLFVAGSALAHGVGFSQVHLRLNGRHIEGTWEVQPRDAWTALGRELPRSGAVGWPDVQVEEASLREYVLRRLSLTANGSPCRPEPAAAPLEWPSDQRQALVRFGYLCPSEPARIVIDCSLLFDHDPMHRAYFSLEDDRVTHLGVFREDQRSATIEVHTFHWGAGFVEFVREGIAHIWGGFDHMLFLLTLLLPAPLARDAGAWTRRTRLRATCGEAVKIVTAFTVAHSLTLCLAFFGFLAPPARWVEVGIALSVFAAAWNNLHPFLPGRAWAIALAFGLVHGLGFAGVLRNLALPIHARGLALAAFNVGVELGQLAIVAAVLPLLHATSRRESYPRLVMGLGSFGIAWVAALWILERAFGLSLLGRLV